MPGFSPKLPLSKHPSDGYTLTQTVQEAVKQNLKNLLFTIPGERIMDPHFGVGIKTFLFEQNDNHSYSIVKTKISQQIEQYMPFVNLTGIEIEQDDDNRNVIYLKINYMIAPLNQADQMDLKVKT